MMAEMHVGVGAVISATANIMARDPSAVIAVMTRDPDPIIALVPVTAAVIIRPITNVDREIDRFRLRRRQGRRHCHYCS